MDTTVRQYYLVKEIYNFYNRKKEEYKKEHTGRKSGKIIEYFENEDDSKPSITSFIPKDCSDIKTNEKYPIQKVTEWNSESDDDALPFESFTLEEIIAPEFDDKEVTEKVLNRVKILLKQKEDKFCFTPFEDNCPSILDVDRDKEHEFNKRILGDPVKVDLLKTITTKNAVQFRTFLHTIQPINTTENSVTYEIFDDDYTCICDILFFADNCSSISKLTFSIGKYNLLNCDYEELDMIKRTNPNAYHKQNVIPLRDILKNFEKSRGEFPMVVPFVLHIESDEPLINSCLTAEFTRKESSANKRDKLIGHEIMTAHNYFVDLNGDDKYEVEIPNNLQIISIMVKSDNPNVSVKIGDRIVQKSTNPYYSYHDLIVPHPNIFYYYAIPSSIAPNLTRATGLLHWNDDMKLNITGSGEFNAKVLIRILNFNLIDKNNSYARWPDSLENFIVHEP